MKQITNTVFILCGVLFASASRGSAAMIPLTAGAEVSVPRIAVSVADHGVYGVLFEYRSDDGAVVVPRRCYQYSGERRTTYQHFHPGYGLLFFAATPDWQEGRAEVLLKAGTTALEVSFRLLSGETAELRGIRLVPGGFPESPPVAAAPYADWIASLEANLSWAAAHPLVILDDEGGSIWWGGDRRLTLSDADLDNMARETAPYLAVTAERLIELMPERRPFHWRVADSQRRALVRPLWNPLEPEICYNPDGSLCDYKTTYPLTGYEEVVAPSGRTIRVPYHHPPEAPVERVGREANPRVYWDAFMTSARVSEMVRNAYFLALRYRRDGDAAAGLRAAAITWSLARRLPDYPQYGSSTSRWPWHRFWPPDTFELDRAFIVGTWHPPAMRLLAPPVRTFDLLRDAPDIWLELDRLTGRDSRADIAASLLGVARLSLLKDASHRVTPVHYYHNVANYQSQMMLEIGMAIGCPELIHYGVNKTLATLRVGFMADGMFPESTSYMGQVLGQYRSVFTLMQGYSDPPAYMSALDGSRYDQFDAGRDGATYTAARELYARLRFPDGNPLTVHDTWPHRFPAAPAAPWLPLVIPEFGHVGLGWGEGETAIAPHLHFSGFYNHGHRDMLNLTLWAYGDELVSDLGYTHVGLYARGSIAHNTVVIDGQPQGTGHAGSLIALHVHADAAQAVLAGGTHVYDVSSRYRRGLVLVPFGNGRDALVDLFEVSGGTRHDWLANGCADYAQELATTLTPTETLDNLAADGVAVTAIGRSEPVPAAGSVSPFWGTFRQARLAHPSGPWQVTWTAGEPLPPGTPGAGPRASDPGVKPGLRLHWLAPQDVTAILARAPRCRYADEVQHPAEAAAAFSRDLLHKVIVRREGEDLESTFVAVWEPFRDAPGLDAVRQLAGVPAADGIGVSLTSGAQHATVLYRRPEAEGLLDAGGIRSDALYTILRRGEAEQALDAYDGSFAEADGVAVTLEGVPTCLVTEVRSDAAGHLISVAGDLSAYPADRARQPHAGGFVTWRQEGQGNRWLPLQGVERGSPGEWLLWLDRAPGFTYDAVSRVLDETHAPLRRGLQGAARIALPQWVTLRWRLVADRPTDLRVRASAALTLQLSGVTARSATVRHGDQPQREIPVQMFPGAAHIRLDPAEFGCGWLQVSLNP